MGQSTDHVTTPAVNRAPSASHAAPNGLDAEAVAEAIVQEGVAPSVAAGCAARGEAAWRVEIGGAVDTLFDLASLTKPMTAVAIARAKIDPQATLGSLLPELAGSASGGAPIELLLAHRAGLEAHVPMFAPLARGERVDAPTAVRAAADARRDDARGEIPAEGFAPVYSDLGYVLAGAALARHVGARDAGEAIAQLVVAPLGLELQLGTARELEARGIDLARLAAPTEDVAWRGGVVRGRVHDENAWALTGDGGSGHAGMFGTVAAVMTFGCALLDVLLPDYGFALRLGDSRSLAWLVSPRAGGTLRAGFDGKSASDSSAGSLCGPRTFGHLGFTGTSLWIDPDARAVVALLTNRVHPTREHIAIRAVRPRAHDALFARARSLGAP
jgi:CubicO group peptidase (beta-lactamase class C family)